MALLLCLASPAAAAEWTMEVTSPSFGQGARVPQQFTCKGRDVSPALSWSGAPDGTKSFALIMDDPDAPVGTWVHWVAYDIPAEETGLREEAAPGPGLGTSGLQGKNSWGRLGYGGPCPPTGQHRYFFKVYALDVASLGLPAGASKDEVLAAMKGHVLAQGQLKGVFSK
jgi:Raf kinase inhibitor-like YbhB/YbcL family protein